MTTSLSVALLSHLVPPRRDEVADLADLEATLDRQWGDGSRAWPTVALAPEVYLRHLAACIRDRVNEPGAHVIRTMPATDLYLAAACAEKDPAAILAFRDTQLPTLYRALAKLGQSTATVDETVQRVLMMLFVGDHGRPQIETYTGRGTLRSWLRSIGVRTGRRLMGTEHGVNQDDDDELDALPASVRDPELELLRVRYGDHVRDALAGALTTLTERQRNVLRQYYIDGLTIDQLAALYQVNRATTARWVTSARIAVVAATSERLVSLGIDANEVNSIIRLVRSQLEISVRELGNG